MKKAIFLDFYGTVVHEHGPQSYKVIERVFRSGHANNPEEVMHQWNSLFQKRLEDAQGDNHRLQYELSLENFEEIINHFNSNENAKELLDIMVDHWCNPPIYDDAKEFLIDSNLPIYFVTNSDDVFINKAVQYHGLKVSGIVTSEQSKYSKPMKEIFLYALEKWGLNAHEVVHIGDSLRSDVECAEAAGIEAIWLNRNNQSQSVPEGITVVSDFKEVMKYIN
ncbi:HAD family hydrolase [Paenibacillus illinoisensis]|uniref:HAD family hydrolase n=1 Tax=Paenibacillus illinoisensis TaxID=59845 RepID=UPI003D284596